MAFSRNLVLTALALTSFAAAPAYATVQAVPISEYSPSSVYGAFNINSVSDIDDKGNAGRFLDTIQDTTTLASMSVYTFCIDAQTYFETFSPYNIVAISSVVSDATKDEQLAALLGHADATIASAASPTDASNAAAGFQLAVWAVFYDTGVDSGYDLTTGNFNTNTDPSGDFAAGTVPYTLASTYLANISDGTWTGNASQVKALIAVTPYATQNQIFLAAVPEPKSWLSMILGFGILGAVLRRRPNFAAIPA